MTYSKSERQVLESHFVIELRGFSDVELLNDILILLASKPLTPTGNMLLCSIEDELQRRQQEDKYADR